MTHRVTLLALDECFASNLVGFADLLHTANLVAAHLDARALSPFKWQVASADGRPVRTSNGLTLKVDGAARDLSPGALIVVPAFGSPQPEHSLSVLQRHSRLLIWLREQHAAGVTLAACCSGSFLLAESGLLDGRCATTSWWLGTLFRRRYPAVRLELGSMLRGTRTARSPPRALRRRSRPSCCSTVATTGRAAWPSRARPRDRRSRASSAGR